jgi:dihydroflavonol-4-reductase
MTLERIVHALAAVSGRPAPRLRLPYGVALAAGHVSDLIARVLDREPLVPLEGVRMARHKMFVDSSKARAELGFQSGSVEAALDRAVCWYRTHRFVKGHSDTDAPRRTAISA